MRRAQATIEFLALTGVVLALVGAVAFAGGDWARHLVESIPGQQHTRRDDRWALRSDPYGPLIRRYVPTLVLERDRYGADASVPVDVAVCRSVWCAALGTGRPAVFTHVVRRPGSPTSSTGSTTPTRARCTRRSRRSRGTTATTGRA